MTGWTPAPWTAFTTLMPAETSPEGRTGSVTEVTNYYAYLLAFDFNEIGYSSAVTIVMLLLVVAVSLGVVWMGRRREAME